MSKAIGGSTFNVLDDAWNQQQLQQHHDWLLALDKQPDALLSYLPEQRFFKLGHYFEALVGFWLTNSNSFEWVKRNIQINTTKRTLGEADLLLKPSGSNLIQHWELAVKYYLCSNGSAEWKTWIGPNPADSLADKMHTLSQRQLKLFETPEGKSYLKANDIKAVAPQLFLKGYFFNDLNTGKVCLPKNAGNSSLAWWCYRKDVGAYLQSNESWAILSKAWWLSPALFREEQLEVLTAQQMAARLNTPSHANFPETFMIASVEKEENSWKEMFRIMVVENIWPN